MYNLIKDKIKHWQFINVGLVFFDIISINFAYFFALLLRFDFRYSNILDIYMDAFIKMAPIYTIICIFVFSRLKFYRSLWRFASVQELFKGIYATLITSVIYIAMSLIFFVRMPFAFYIAGGLIQFVLTTGIRFTYRIFILLDSKNKITLKKNNVLIIGAGEAGRLIFNDIGKYEEENYVTKAFIDDNENKWGRYISNVPIYGGRGKIEEAVSKFDINLIIIAIPSADLSDRKEVIEICKETGCKLKIIPSIPELMVNSNVTVKQLKDVQIDDLLERKAIEINSKETLKNINGKTVLITGGGGTIGSELCRQIAKNGPKKLIIYDIYENNAYEIQQELKRNYPNLDLVTLIGSVREEKRLDDIFNEYRPNIVYHAAAHKHVPLMEVSPNEAIKNNIYGTYNTAFAALRYKCDKFILISTDKAVNPTNVMGATKRACEMIIQSMQRVSDTKDISILPKLKEINHNNIREYDTDFVTNFVAVRFGNVLGSNGSVIPLFKKQIAEGGPVTITHKDIIRYFMTIPEAVGLVIEAGFYAKGGEIFVLDMGEPVKIDTLARNLIKLSGLTPEKDIDIVYTGLRPGEKLYEEKLMEEEGLKKTDNSLIHVAKPLDFDSKLFFDQLESLEKFAFKNDEDEVLIKISEIIPTYHSPEEDIERNKDKFEKMYESSK